MRSFLPILFGFFLAAALAGEKRGDNPDAPPVSPQEELAKFHVPPGFEVQLVAAEPDIQKPINLTFDAAGQLWVTGSEMYPWPASTDANGRPIPDFDKGWQGIVDGFRVGDQAPTPAREGRDTVRVLSEFDATGHAGKIVVFADELNIPSGVQPLPHDCPAIAAVYGLGPVFDPNPAMEKRGPIADRHLGKTPKGESAIVYSIPNIWLMADWDGDGLAESRLPLYTGFGYTDTHGGASSFLYWIDGWIYGTHGFRNHSEVRDLKGNVTVLDSGNTYRFKPDGSAFEIYTHGQTNPFGLTVDPLGNFYSADSHSKPVYMLLRGGYYEGIGKQHDGLGFAPRITDDDHGSSAIAGIAYYADDKFPEEFRGNLFNGNPVTRKINRDKLEWHGSTPKAIRMPDFLTCDDPWFRPVQVKLGPDGALYIADFYNPIIGHYEVPLTDPRRDHTHGRIWRVVWRGGKHSPVLPMPDLSGLTADELVKKLAEPSLIVRTLATNELVDRAGKDTTAQLTKRLTANPPGSPVAVPDANARVHAWWALSRVGDVPLDDLMSAWEDPSPVVRAHFATMLPMMKTREQGAGLIAGASSLKGVSDADATVRRASVANIIGGGLVNLGLLLKLWDEAALEDAQLFYSIKMALRDSLALDHGYESAGKFITKPEYATRLADVSLAVKTPAAADFLIVYLERTKLETPRAGEYLKHVLLYLAAEKLDAVVKLVRQVGNAPLPRRLALATNLAEATRQRGIALPEITTWSHGVILETLASNNDELTKPAIAAVRDVKLDAKLAPLAKIARDEFRNDALRLAALEAAANLPASHDLLTKTFADPRHMILRKRAAELLAQNGDTAVVLAALPKVPDELALSICGALAKSDAGAAALLDAIDAGKTSPRFLTNKAVSGPLSTRPSSLRVRAAILTKDLPPEDARLNTVIAERTAAFVKAKPDTTHGAQVFQQNCAACHRFRDAGGNVGPNLDGVVARGPARLIEDILDPNRNVDPGFRQTTIETTDGDTLLGANLRDQGDTILFADPTGKDTTIAKAKIKKQTTSALSLMPPTFESAISIGDFYDLLGYLLGPDRPPIQVSH